MSSSSSAELDEREEEDSFMERLKRDYPQVMARSTSAHSPRRFSSAQSQMEIPHSFYEDDGRSLETRFSSMNSLSQKSVGRKDSSKNHLGLYSEEAVQRVLENSSAAISSVGETISHVNQLSARNSSIRGSTKCITEQLEHMKDLFNTVSNRLDSDEVSESN